MQGALLSSHMQILRIVAFQKAQSCISAMVFSIANYWNIRIQSTCTAEHTYKSAMLSCILGHFTSLLVFPKGAVIKVQNVQPQVSFYSIVLLASKEETINQSQVVEWVVQPQHFKIEGSGTLKGKQLSRG